MSRFFCRFERLAFGIVTASAIICAGVLIIHRYGDLLSPESQARHAVPGFPFGLVCGAANRPDSCNYLIARRKAGK
ncbi:MULTISPECIES: hypothetical protein [unclassified Paraburkholderia]|uniref:hypothetical protein n=1 Tax=unclassified Paraburkholderia TaxID=2615204 RepID=UPI002AAFE571|nr:MULTISPECIES: hypothetical protein [unclassified Paraburkholderia]